MKIGEVAKAAGIGIDAVRFYERQGLIPEPPRQPSGYRVYSPDVVLSLRFIRRAKELGFSLKEIAELLSLETAADATAVDVKKLAEAKLAEWRSEFGRFSGCEGRSRKLWMVARARGRRAVARYFVPWPM